ncbi:hypothetical protein HDU83_009808 [Entophlyctis luteolus]|nr:hypothetical protein HDU83_009808 [Entophlyctis luteolus]
MQAATRPRGAISLSERIREVVVNYLPLSYITFGGPQAHIALLLNLFVVKRRWLSEEMFAELYAISNALPGPASTQLAFTVALIRGGVVPGILAFLIWSIPGGIVMGSLGYGVGQLGAASIPVWVLYVERSLASIGIALVALAAKQLSSKLLTDKTTSTLAAIAAALVINFSFVQWLIPAVMICGGAATYLKTFGVDHYKRFQGKKSKIHVENGSILPPLATVNENEALVHEENGSESGNRDSIHLLATSATDIANTEEATTRNSPEENRDLRIYFSYSMATGAVLIAVFFLLLISTAVIRYQNVTQALNIFSTFYFVGAIIFGGGPVVVPLLYSYVVSSTSWLTPTEFLMGFAIINIMPGPNFNFAAFCGALAYRTNGWTTFVGALLAWIGIFLPGLILKAGILPIWRHHRDLPALRAIFRGLNSVAVGLLFAAVYLLWMKAVALPDGGVDNLGNWPGWTATMVAAVLAVDVWKIEPYWVVLAGAAIGGIMWVADGRPTL